VTVRTLSGTLRRTTIREHRRCPLLGRYTVDHAEYAATKVVEHAPAGRLEGNDGEAHHDAFLAWYRSRW
jgi:hypothetical protein